MALTLTLDDLSPFAPDLDEAKANIMVADTIARAVLVAPCIAEEDLDVLTEAAAKAIIRDVILRWHDQGPGIIVQRQTSVGPYQQSETVDSSRSKPRFWPSEVRELQTLCKTAGASRGKAFSIDLAQPTYAPVFVTLPDGEVVDLRVRPDLWLEYGRPA